MQKKEKLLTPADEFLESKESLSLEGEALKNEVKESVAEVLAGENDGDIEPVFRLFDQQTKKSIESGTMREKIFWEIVGEVLKKDFFEGIYRKIVPFVEGGKYNEVDSIVNKELAVTIQKLSPTIHRDLTKRGFAVTVLKKQFYSFLPEVDALVRGEVEGKKPQGKIPAGRFMEQQEADIFSQMLDDLVNKIDKKNIPKFPRFTKEKTWLTPKLDEIKPELIVEWRDIESGSKGSFEVLDFPFQDDHGSWWVKVKIISGLAHERGIIKETSLADHGIMPYRKVGWNNRYRPIRWYKKEPQK